MLDHWQAVRTLAYPGVLRGGSHWQKGDGLSADSEFGARAGRRRPPLDHA
jgi:hypothetical protein